MSPAKQTLAIRKDCEGELLLDFYEAARLPVRHRCMGWVIIGRRSYPGCP